jgi:predicted transcriptional regulator
VLDVFTHMRRRRAYTSVMSLMNVMADKGLLRRRRRGRAFLYEPRIAREATLADMVGDLCDRAFESSAPLLVSRLLEQANPSREELDEIRRVIDEFRRKS